MPVNGHLEWDAVYKPGYVKATGYKNGRKVMEKRIETAGAPAEAVWTHDSVGDIIVANVKMVDSKCRFVPTANCEVEFKTPSAEWKILGWGNGDPAFQYVERPVGKDADNIKIQTFNGCAQVIIQKK